MQPDKTTSHYEKIICSPVHTFHYNLALLLEKKGGADPGPNPPNPPQDPKPVVYDETGCLYTSYNGLLMAGYQGWFAAQGDASERE